MRQIVEENEDIKSLGIRMKVEYWGDHRGMRFKIVKSRHYEDENRFSWCHYVIAHLDRIPQKQRRKFTARKKTFRGRTSYDYYKTEWANLEWHGGITYYEKLSKNLVEVGCDYQHLHDERRDYSLSYIVSQAKETIDSFWVMVPDSKVWCSGNGNIYNVNEGEFKNGVFWSNDWTEKARSEKETVASE